MGQTKVRWGKARVRQGTERSQMKSGGCREGVRQGHTGIRKESDGVRQVSGGFKRMSERSQVESGGCQDFRKVQAGVG